MKKWWMVGGLWLMVVAGAWGGSVTISSIDVEASEAVTVTGPQSNAIALATAHVADGSIHVDAEQVQRIARALTNEQSVVRDSMMTNVFWRLNGGTNLTAYTFSTNVSPQLILTYSEDFVGAQGGRPAYTNVVIPYPFVDNENTDLGNNFTFSPNTAALYIIGPNFEQWNYFPQEAPATLTALDGGAVGSAYLDYYPITNTLASYNLVTGDVWQVVQEHLDAADPHPGLHVAITGGVATNLSARGWLALPQSQATNLVLRLVASNEHINVEWSYP